VEPRGPDVMKHESTGERTLAAALHYWKANRPALLFVHLDGVDHAGHETGWLSRNYYNAVAQADGYLGRVLDMLDKEAWESTYVLVTSDHGGTRHGHGRNSLAEILIPWILAGPGIHAGRLSVPVNTYDSAVTLAWIYNLDMPACWTGRPVRAAFETSVMLSRARTAPAPRSSECTPGSAGHLPLTGVALQVPSDIQRVQP
jgi:arylsulfatase A-like enzyme